MLEFSRLLQSVKVAHTQDEIDNIIAFKRAYYTTLGRDLKYFNVEKDRKENAIHFYIEDEGVIQACLRVIYYAQNTYQEDLSVNYQLTREQIQDLKMAEYGALIARSKKVKRPQAKVLMIRAMLYFIHHRYTIDLILAVSLPGLVPFYQSCGVSAVSYHHFSHDSDALRIYLLASPYCSRIKNQGWFFSYCLTIGMRLMRGKKDAEKRQRISTIFAALPKHHISPRVEKSMCQLFHSMRYFSLRDIRKLIGIEMHVRQGSLIFREGVSDLELMLLVLGKLQATRQGNVLFTLEPGGFFGESAFFSDHDLRDCTVTALEDSVIVTIRKTVLNRELSKLLKNPIAKFLLFMLENHYNLPRLRPQAVVPDKFGLNRPSS